MSIAFTVAMIYKPDGKVDAIAEVIRDETARFADERALKKRIAELEAAANGAGPNPAPAQAPTQASGAGAETGCRRNAA